MTRRNGIIKALATCLAFMGGKRLSSQEIETTGIVSTSEVFQQKRFTLSMHLEKCDGIDIYLDGEHIRIAPKEIMEALRAK